MAPYRIVISCLLVSTRPVMTNHSVKCQQLCLGPFSPNTGHYLIREPPSKSLLHNFMGLNSTGWLAEKLPRRVDKATVKHDFIYSTYTLLSGRVTEDFRHWCLQKKPKNGSERNCVACGGDRSKMTCPFKLAMDCTV